MRFMVLFVLAVVISGCLGRSSDLATTSRVNVAKLGLNSNQPAVLVFAAVWCKPCRAEIPEFNQLQRDYGGQLQVSGLLVEGEEKGKLSSLESINNFYSPKNEVPNYKMNIDRNWELFDQLGGRDGRQLPTIAFLGKQGELKRLVQRSLDYETELKPLVESLIQDSLTAEEPEKKEEGHSIQVMTAEIWSARPGNGPLSEKYKNFALSLSKGRQKFNFSESNMPFLKGSISFYTNSSGSDIPVKGFWSYKSENGTCSLTIRVHEDGSFLSASGVCI